MSDNSAAQSNQDPDPLTQPGVPASPAPGEIPPDAGSMSGAAGDAVHAPNVGPVSGNRTPMFIALGFIAFIAVAFAVLVGASFIAS